MYFIFLQRLTLLQSLLFFASKPLCRTWLFISWSWSFLLPFKPSGQILVKNDYSWNKARDNLVFLENWFNKFPEYKNRDLFITGESYGGHYVPQLAQQVIQSELQFNLKGIARGNPLLEFSTDFNSTGEYYWSHGSTRYSN